MILEDISLAFSMDNVNFSQKVPLEFSGRYTQYISKLLVDCSISIHKISALFGSKSYHNKSNFESFPNNLGIYIRKCGCSRT